MILRAIVIVSPQVNGKYGRHYVSGCVNIDLFLSIHTSTLCVRARRLCHRNTEYTVQCRGPMIDKIKRFSNQEYLFMFSRSKSPNNEVHAHYTCYVL